MAGRTDAGVHAAAQVAQIDLPRVIDARRLRDALNYHMKPQPVVVVRAAPAPEGSTPEPANESAPDTPANPAPGQ